MAEDLIQELRARAATLPFESPSRGAVILTRLSWRLPPSESIAALSELQRAREIIRKTIAHSHLASHGLDQFGDGSWASFSRHVSEGDERWDFTIEVRVGRSGHAEITDVTVVRPGDDVADPDDPDAEPIEPRAPLTAADLVPFGMIACPCCGHATITQRDHFEICAVCFWEDDGQDNPDAHVERGGPNKVSLAQGRANFLAFGASCEADPARVRRPTREEVQLRHFAPDGSELA